MKKGTMTDQPVEPTYSICLLPPVNLQGAFLRAARYAPPDASVQKAEDLHVTLLSGLRIPRKKPNKDLLQRIENIQFPAFDVRFTDADSFNEPPGRNNKHTVVWLRPDGLSSFRLQELHNKVAGILSKAGYNMGTLPYRPHMTFLRQPLPGDTAGLEDFLKKSRKVRYPVLRADTLTLTRKLHYSEPAHPEQNDGQGSKYEVVAAFPLKQQDGAAPPCPC